MRMYHAWLAVLIVSLAFGAGIGEAKSTTRLATARDLQEMHGVAFLLAQVKPFYLKSVVFNFFGEGKAVNEAYLNVLLPGMGASQLRGSLKLSLQRPGGKAPKDDRAYTNGYTALLLMAVDPGTYYLDNCLIQSRRDDKAETLTIPAGREFTASVGQVVYLGLFSYEVTGPEKVTWGGRSTTPVVPHIIDDVPAAFAVLESVERGLSKVVAGRLVKATYLGGPIPVTVPADGTPRARSGEARTPSTGTVRQPSGAAAHAGALARPTERVKPAPEVNPNAVIWRTPEPPVEPQAGDVWVNPKDGAEMVYVPAGEFIMGSTDADIAAVVKENPKLKSESFAAEKPQFRANLPGYWIDKCEVTVAQYRKFCQETAREMPPAPKWGWQDDHPIVYVTWDDAVAYARWAEKRLPTELEWEKAARGTDGRLYPWGSQWPPPAGSGNFADEALKREEPDLARLFTSLTYPPLSGYDDGYAHTAPVGKFPRGASPFGVLDMAGNVWEWCADWDDEDAYKRYAKGELTPPASGTYIVLRGGSWAGDGPSSFRCACRSGIFALRPDARGGGDGFRCVRSAGASLPPSNTALAAPTAAPAKAQVPQPELPARHTDGLVVIEREGRLLRLPVAGGELSKEGSLEGSRPVAQPSGSLIAFVGKGPKGQDLFVGAPDGSGLKNVSNLGATPSGYVWSQDGRKLAFVAKGQGGKGDIYVVGADGSGLTNVTNSPADDSSPEWGAGSRWLAFRLKPGDTADSQIAIWNSETGVRVVWSGDPISAFATSPQEDKIALTAGREKLGLYLVEVPSGTSKRVAEVANAGIWQSESVSFSPDGAQLAVADGRGISVGRSDGSGMQGVAPDGRYHVWSLDSKRLAYLVRELVRDGTFIPGADAAAISYQLWGVDASGANRHQIWKDCGSITPVGWTPDSGHLLFTIGEPVMGLQSSEAGATQGYASAGALIIRPKTAKASDPSLVVKMAETDTPVRLIRVDFASGEGTELAAMSKLRHPCLVSSSRAAMAPLVAKESTPSEPRTEPPIPSPPAEQKAAETTKAVLSTAGPPHEPGPSSELVPLYDGDLQRLTGWPKGLRAKVEVAAASEGWGSLQMRHDELPNTYEISEREKVIPMEYAYFSPPQAVTGPDGKLHFEGETGVVYVDATTGTRKMAAPGQGIEQCLLQGGGGRQYVLVNGRVHPSGTGIVGGRVCEFLGYEQGRPKLGNDCLYQNTLAGPAFFAPSDTLQTRSGGYTQIVTRSADGTSVEVKYLDAKGAPARNVCLLDLSGEPVLIAPLTQ